MSEFDPFFFLASTSCMKNEKSVGRIRDLSLMGWKNSPLPSHRHMYIVTYDRNTSMSIG